MMPFSVHAQSWYDTAWTYRQGVVIDSDHVDFSLSGDLSNYPVLIELTNGANDLFGKAQSDGDDILFTASDGTTKLPHELEDYDDTGGSEVLRAWVQVPTFFSGSNTVVYLYYGNSSSGNQENASGVWSANFAGVWHLEEEVAGTGTANLYLDSTANPNDGDDFVSATGQSGKIGNGQQFDGTDDYIDCGTDASLDVNYITIQFWINVSTWVTNGGIIAKGDNAWRQYWLWTYSSEVSYEIDEGALQNNASTPTALQWDHVVFTYDGSDVVTYKNGTQENSYPQVTGTIDATAQPLLFGYIPTFDYMDGYLDEVRISGVARSTDWIKADYVDQNSPAAYLGYQAVEDLPIITASTLAADNGYLDITFSEGVYNTSGGSGALETTDFTITFTQNGGTATNATIASVTRTDNNPLTGGETDIRVHLTVTGSPSGVESIEINPVAGSIFDAGGYAASDTTTSGLETLNALAPTFVSVTADDPDDGDTVYGNGDTITVVFSDNTNQPAVATKANLDAIFSFNQALGASYTGSWSAADTLVITVVNDTGAAPPTIGGLQLTFQAGNGLKNAAATSPDASGTSPALVGDWGNSLGPTITGSTLATDNGYLDVAFSEGVYRDAGINPVQVSDFSLVFSKNGGLATGAVITGATQNDGVTPLGGGETTVRLHLSVSGTVSGTETIEVTPADGSSIFNNAGNPASASETTGQVALNTRLAEGRVIIRSNIINPRRGEVTTLNIRLDGSSKLNITVYDLAGDPVKVLYNRTAAAGVNEVVWDGKNRRGNAVVPGVYYVVVRIEKDRHVHKVLVVK
jgi:hypothetical protein